MSTRAPDPADQLGFLIWHVSQAVNLQGEHALSPLGLTLAQGAALRVLARSPGLSAAELARRVGVTPQTVKATVDGLVERGLVERTASATHGRVLELTLTADGVPEAHAAHEAVVGIDDDLTRDLSASERRTLLHLMTRVVARVSPRALPGR